MSKRRLGKGIDALLQGRDLEQLSNMSSILSVPVDHVQPNPDQPRKHFSDASLQELADSIAEKGIIQPILAEDRGDGHYTIIAGERRYRAAKLAGLEEIPVISQEFSDDEKLEIALIENIQREDLNPVDEARAIKLVMEHSGDTQDVVAKRLGKSRSAVANALRLLNLEQEIIDGLVSGKISGGHARALLAVADSRKRLEFYRDILRTEMSVRAAENRADELKRAGTDERTSIGDPEDPVVSGPAGGDGDGGSGDGPKKSVELKRIEEHLIHHFATRVVIKGTDKKGRVELEYHSTEDLERLLERMNVDISG